MTFLLISFLAGVLTVLAPCILPLLPVVVGSSAAGRRSTPYVVVLALAASIILFTYVLKASTAFIMVPQEAWVFLSGGILVLFGLSLVFPALWERIPGLSRLSASSNKMMGAGYQKKSAWGDALVGAALGPIFSTCSPTYFVILASVLPASFLLGSAYLLAYVLGLSLVLLLIAILGQRFADRLTGLADSRGLFKRAVGILFIVLGVSIALGWEKKLETALLESGYFDVTQIEQKLLKSAEEKGDMALAEVAGSGPRYVEIAEPAGFVNTDGITIGELVGKKVILVDFMTYSCINCQRTFPYMVAWYDRYKDEGLEIIGIHTPEFAFEKDIGNVREAMKKFGITYPVVLDNDYGTWRAYGNSYWPRKYLIDIHGRIVYDHIGEGAYEETEMKIRELLEERARVLGAGAGTDGALATHSVKEISSSARSPETYFGSLRNEFLANGTPGAEGERSFSLPESIYPNALYLGGTWNIAPEYAESVSDARVVYHYSAGEVYIVAESDGEGIVEVWQDGKKVESAGGEDVKAGILRVSGSRLYKVIKNETPGEHVLELRAQKGVRFFAFTFG